MSYEIDTQTAIAFYMLLFVVFEFLERTIKHVRKFSSEYKNRKGLVDGLRRASLTAIVLGLLAAPVIYYGNNSIKVQQQRLANSEFIVTHTHDAKQLG